MNVFYQGYNKKEWAGILHNKMEPFFRLVSLMLSHFLRQRLMQAVHDFVAIFNGDEFSPIYQTIKGAKPITFAIKLLLDAQTKKFDPPLADIQSTIEGLFESMLTCIDHLPNIETQLFATPGVPKEKERLAKETSVIRVNVESIYPDQVKQARKTLSENLSRLLKAPQKQILDFDQHAPIISNAITADVDAFLQDDHPQMRQIEARPLYVF